MSEEKREKNNTEWSLLVSIAHANNSRDLVSLYAILNDEDNDFSDKPRCVSAAIFSIELTSENVENNRDALIGFVEKVGGVEVGMVEQFRLDVLKGMLAPLTDEYKLESEPNKHTSKACDN